MTPPRHLCSIPEHSCSTKMQDGSHSIATSNCHIQVSHPPHHNILLENVLSEIYSGPHTARSIAAHNRNGPWPDKACKWAPRDKSLNNRALGSLNGCNRRLLGKNAPTLGHIWSSSQSRC